MRGVVINDRQVLWANGFKSNLPDRKTALLTANSPSLLFCAEILLKNWMIFDAAGETKDVSELRRAINQLSDAVSKCKGMEDI